MLSKCLLEFNRIVIIMEKKVYIRPVMKMIGLYSVSHLAEISTQGANEWNSREQQSVRFDWDDENEE